MQHKHKRKTLHKVLQTVLDVEQVFEMNCFEDVEKKEDEVDLQSNNTGEVEEEMSVCNVPTTSGVDTNWQKNDMKQFSVLTALSHSFEVEAQEMIQHEEGEDELRRTLHGGVSLARFLNEAGWHVTAGRVYFTCLALLANQEEEDNLLHILHLLSCLLDTAISSSQVKEASIHAQILQKYLDKKVTGKLLETPPDVALAFKALSSYWFQKSQFDQSHAWTWKALQALSPKTPTHVSHSFPSRASLTGRITVKLRY